MSFVEVSRATDAAATLTRTLEGRITFWSPAMEERYGYSAKKALGKISYQLLRTSSWQTHDEIQSELLEQHTWCGGLIHRRAGGQPVMSANYWHLYGTQNGRDMLVTEMHADIVSVGSIVGRQIGDIIATFVQEMSQPLTAAQSYLLGSQRALQPAWPDRVRSDQGLAQMAKQFARATEIVRTLRDFSETLREFERQRRRPVVLRDEGKGIVQSGQVLRDKTISLRPASHATRAARSLDKH